MNKLIRLSIGVAVFVALGAFGALAMPQEASAQAAGPGGGGGQSGCPATSFSTCYGAVWRYYKTTQDPYNIPNLGGGSTVVSGCRATGGFFAYVLQRRSNPNSATDVRSWKIGNQNGQNSSSIFFGGYTNYILRSNPSDPAPSNPTSGQYSWYSAQRAFERSTALGQNRGFQWNRQSQLGWFCYQGSNFDLTTSISGNTRAAEPGATVTISPTINNSGATASSSASWRVIQRIVREGQTIPGAGGSAIAPEAYYGAGSTAIRNGSGTFPRGATAIASFGTVMPDIGINDRVCFALSVTPRSSTSSNWYHSDPFCVVIAKSPKLQVIGGDVIVGTGASASNIVTSFVRKNVSGQDRTFGSWGEYAIAVNGTIVGMASGAGYSGGAIGNFCSVSLLTVTNAGTNVCTDATPKGGYAVSSALPAISDRFVSSQTQNLGATAAIDIGDAALQGIYTVADSLTITNTGAASLPVGKWIVINAPRADVTISDSLLYTSQSLSSISEIPQLIIIADTISIEADVQRVDAWLVATGDSGTINTCSEISDPAQAGSPLTANRCVEQLTVNGPVVAKRLLLYRTAGAGTLSSSGDPAEVFNLRPDAYLWAAYYNSTAGRVPTVTTRELPPRF